MPNYLVLTDRKTGERFQGRDLIKVDERMCEALGVPCDPVEWHEGWCDWPILYMANDWAKVREFRSGPIVDWLEATFTLDGYYCPR